MRIKGKRVLVYGLGMCGQSACKLLHDRGAYVSIYDDEKRFSNVYSFCSNPKDRKFDIVVLSPEVKVLGNDLISFFKSQNVKVISELDLGYMFCRAKIIAITGTNGKTTVSRLVGNIFERAGRKTFVCGRTRAFTSVVERADKKSFVILPVSGHQLESSLMFKGDEVAILNLSFCHGGCEGNLVGERKILMGKRQKVVLNFDDEGSKLSKNDKKIMFFSKYPLQKGVFVKNGGVYHNKTRIISLNDIPLLGEKNLENVLASTCLALGYKIKPQIIKRGISEFVSLPHRLEYLGNLNGCDVFNDSGATNISATLGSIDSVGDRGLILMIGGECDSGDEIFARGYSFEEVICFGEGGEGLATYGKGYGYQTRAFKSMKEASFYARGRLKEGGKILFSPACEGGEFSSFAVRGEIFKEIMLGEYEKIEG